MNPQAYVVSDLHLGAGPQDRFDPFRRDAELRDFVDRLTDEQRAGHPTTLFLNGDIIDFARIPPLEVPESQDHLLWDEQASLHKLGRAVAGHPEVFAALARLVGAGGEVHFIAGNHDLDLAWPAVAAALKQTLGASGRVHIGLEPRTYHGVWIEHGYSFTPENRPRLASCIHECPEAGTHDLPAPRYLERVWGTDFMLHVLRDIEREEPALAGQIGPLPLLVFHALRTRPAWFHARHVVRLLLFLKRQCVAAAVFRAALMHDGTITQNDVIGAMGDGEWRGAARDALRDPRFDHELTDTLEELGTEQRAWLSASGIVELQGPAAMGSAAQLGGEDGRALRAASERLDTPGVRCVVFGHTHQVAGGERQAYFNPGTWLPYLNLRAPEVGAYVRAHGLTKTIGNPALYTQRTHAIHIEAEEGGPRVRLLCLDGRPA